MKTNKWSWLLPVIAFCMLSCNKEKGISSADGVATVYKVAVVMPASLQDHWERMAKWALDNIEQAQKGLSRRVELELEWKDEDAADVQDYLSRVAADDGYVAIIGPYSSAKAYEAAEICRDSEKPLILPIATSTEFQRVFAGEDYVWNLAQSDITQCEVMLTQAVLSECREVFLLTSADDYGRSFSDWFAYQAVELGLSVKGMVEYASETELREAVRQMPGMPGNNWMLLFAPSKEEDALAFDEEYGKLLEENERLHFPMTLCSNVVNSPLLAGKLKNRMYEGIAPCANPTSGFVSAYRTRFGEEPGNGEAQLFDAFLLVAYALSIPDAEGLNDAILKAVDGRDSWNSSWLPADMHDTFAALQAGGLPDLAGVTGDWTFDGRNHSGVLNTIYSHWILRNGTYTTIEYLSTDGGSRTTSTLQAWDAQTDYFQQFEQNAEDIRYGALESNWAVVIGTSDTWANYRHQADALAMYQLLKRHGYDDDHIILIIEDNLAYDPHNLYPGVVKVRPDGENVYQNVQVDYKLSDVNLDDLEQIMLGNATVRLPETLHSGANDNVIVFWCGHGNRNSLAWGSYGRVSGNQVREMVQNLKDQGKFRKMLFAMDACYSGMIGEACTGIPGTLFITAANAYESSKADMMDPEMGIWLSNGFTRIFQETIDETPNISIHDLYYQLARHTTGSHATVYNVEQYGNVYKNTMQEYLK